MDQTADPKELGPFRILQHLGEGGMGTVYLAEQRHPVRRRVALKVLKKGLDSKAFLTRFEAERQALAMMEHSCIAKVFDAGITETGQPYLAMEYVKGVPITEYCDANKLSFAERLSLFRDVCSGVQHAHTKGVMHRDLKPSNVLVTLQDGKPMPKIIDFGLAKAIDHRLIEATLFTEAGQVIGTPEYMSPEQAGVGGLDVDTRTDVYSLGVLLYQLLTGSLPVTREELLRNGWLEMQRMIREEEPKKPSTRITTLGPAAEAHAKARRMPLGELQRRLEGDLDWIVMKALEKDRSRRYTTAQELSADLQRHLDDEPVTAGPPTAGYLLRKLFRRYRAQVVTGMAVVGALGIGLVIALVQWNAAEDAKTAAIASQRETKQERDRAQELLARFDRLRESVAPLKDWARIQSPLPAETSTNLAEYESRLDSAQRLIDQEKRIEDRLREIEASGVREGDVVTFADLSKELLYNSLKDTVRQSREYRGPGGGLQRLRVAVEYLRTAKRVTIDDAADGWKRVVEEVKDDKRFVDLALKPQEGLIPLRKDPQSGLQEFWAPRSGQRPAIANDSRLILDDTAIVFVLLPGGSTQIGRSDRDAPDNEKERHEVQLASYFLAKFELTQGQWLRLTCGKNPSRWKPAPGAPFRPNYPLEGITWNEAAQFVAGFGWVLPTEAQWEHACRAGTTTHWWYGDHREDLGTKAGEFFALRFNAADGLLKRGAGQYMADSALWPEADDGHIVHAPVGSFEPNGFGLHDMHGNVAELTRGDYGLYKDCKHEPGDGLLTGGDGMRVVHRGGSYFKSVEEAGSATRKAIGKDARYDNIGIRVARAIL